MFNFKSKNIKEAEYLIGALDAHQKHLRNLRFDGAEEGEEYKTSKSCLNEHLMDAEVLADELRHADKTKELSSYLQIRVKSLTNDFWVPAEEQVDVESMTNNKLYQPSEKSRLMSAR